MLDLLEVPDPRALGPARLATLNALLQPTLEQIPLDRYLATVSGRLRSELDVLVQRMERDAQADAPALEAIAVHFHWLLEADREAAARFEQFSDVILHVSSLVPPELGASTVEEARDALSVWARYFTDQYIPALAAWRRRSQRQEGTALEATLFASDAAFARWIAEAYPRLKGIPLSPLAYRELRRRSRPTAEVPCIVLLIDSLAYHLVDMLRDVALEAGIVMDEPAPFLASLPTVTDVSMLTAVAGLPPDTVLLDDSIQTDDVRWRREEMLRLRVPGALVRTVTSPAQIADLLRQPSHLYVLVWSELDFLAHACRDADLLDDHIRVSLTHLLSWLTSAVDQHAHLRERKAHLRLLIGTDHGWTDLMHTTPIRRPPVDQAVPHHRLYEVLRTLTAAEHAVLGPEWVVIEGVDYDLPDGRVYLVPAENWPIRRGQARQHGGLSLGEVFVPVIEGAFVRPAYRGVIAVLTAVASLEKEQHGKIHLHLSNPNDVAIEQMVVRCSDLDLYAEVGSLGPGQSTTVGPFAVQPRVSGSVDTVQVTLRYMGEVIGPLPLRLQLPLHIERTAAERMAGDYSRLDDMFA